MPKKIFVFIKNEKCNNVYMIYQVENIIFWKTNPIIKTPTPVSAIPGATLNEACLTALSQLKHLEEVR